MAVSLVAELVGYSILGILINTLLYGFVLGQFLTYFTSSREKEDILPLRLMVWALFMLDNAHSILEFWCAWDIAVTNYGNLASWEEINPAAFVTVWVDTVISLMTQIFLLYRVHVFTKNKFVVGILGFTSVVAFAFGCVTGVTGPIAKTVAKFPELTKWVIIWLSFQSFTDLGIAAALIYALTRSRTGIKRTDAIINQLIVGAIETGLFAALCALAFLFSFAFYGTSSLYVLFATPLGRIYTNTLLHVLNSRKGSSQKERTSVITLSNITDGSQPVQQASTKYSEVAFDHSATQQSRGSTAV